MISKIYSPKWTIQVFIEERICALAVCTNTLSSVAIPILVIFFSFGILTTLVMDLEKVLLLLTIVQ